jgi:peptidyl-tRNA hydrolase, PTH1 family
LILIAGLGNPGREYGKTRHNMGFRVIESWAASMDVVLGSRRFQAKSGKGSIAGRGTILLCPQTYMNRSGMSVRACVDYYGIEPKDILVVHDDIDLPVGRLRVARNGGAGGHKGVQSIIESLGTSEFARLKIGVGRPTTPQPVETFVLTPFGAEDEQVLEEVVQLAVRACETFVTKGLEQAMGDVNGQVLGQKK